ncbi:MAG TPA: MFS transporter [Chloroflexaceae bacterium]|nr:MFS transporter [Chloroflexaceae bacterium]
MASERLPRWLGRPIYYGWPMLYGVSAAQVVSWGILYYAFSVFVAPMQAELGWTTVELTGAYSLALLCSGLAAVPVGRWLDRHGARALMTVGSIAGSLLLVAWSHVSSLAAFYLVMAAIGATTAAVLYEPAFALVAVWFRRQRGRALTVLTFFGAWASFVFIPLSAWLVERLGWRPALLALAGILAVATIPPHLFLLRRRPQDLGLLPDGAPPGGEQTTHTASPEVSVSTAAALRDRGFWWLTVAFGTSILVTVANTVSIIPYLITKGQSPSFAAQVAGLFGLMTLVGRLLIGPLGDRMPRHLVTAGLMAMQMAGLSVLALVPTTTGALVAIALFGAGAGTMTIMRAALLAERYGPANYGSISGMQNVALTGSRTLGPISAGALSIALGGYEWALMVFIGLLGLGLLAILLAGEPTPKGALAAEG